MGEDGTFQGWKGQTRHASRVEQQLTKRASADDQPLIWAETLRVFPRSASFPLHETDSHIYCPEMQYACDLPHATKKIKDLTLSTPAW